MKKHHKNTEFDWRTHQQNPEKCQWFHSFGKTLNILGFISFFPVLMFQGLWLILSMVLLVLSLAVYILAPRYFTLLMQKADQNKSGTAPVKSLRIAMFMPVANLILSGINSPAIILDGELMMLEVVCLALVLVALLYLCCREIRESRGLLLSVVIMTVLVSFGVVKSGNHQLNVDEPPAEPYVVVDKDTRVRRKRKRRHLKRYQYELTLRSDTGDTIEVSVSEAEYQEYQVGDIIFVYVDTGAFGIEYAYIPSLE